MIFGEIRRNFDFKAFRDFEFSKIRGFDLFFEISRAQDSRNRGWGAKKDARLSHPFEVGSRFELLCMVLQTTD